MGGSKILKPALLQYSPLIGDKESNLNLVEHYVVQAAGQKADLILLPEMFLTGYADPDTMISLTEPLSGKSITKICKLASDHKIAIAGSFFEKNTVDGKNYNTCIFAGCDGKILNIYRKTHLFDAEMRYITPGNTLTTVFYKNICFGLLVCFDLEFPEPARLLALKGIDVLLIASANMEPYGPFHRTLCVARAMENHLFVVYCNQTGKTPYFSFVGESCIISPLGNIISELRREEALVVAECDLDDINKSKKVYNYLELRRFEFPGEI